MYASITCFAIGDKSSFKSAVYATIASISVIISLDKMRVTCRFYPPSTNGGKLLSAEDIVSDLAFRKVKYGIDQEAVLSFLNNTGFAALFATVCAFVAFSTAVFATD